MASKIVGKVTVVSIKAPSGLSIKRNGNRFTFGWKRANDYTAQQLHWRWKAGNTTTDWGNITVTAKATSSGEGYLNLDNFGPRMAGTLKFVEMAVRGKYEGEWTEWSKLKYNFEAPGAPTMEVSYDPQYANRSTYTWTAAEDKDHGPRKQTVLQTIKVQNAPADDKALAWDTVSTATVAASDTIYYDESDLADKSWKRAVRIRTEGPGGASEWVYGSYVFAKPNAPTFNVNKADYDKSSHTFNFNVTVAVPKNATTPVEQLSFQYLFGTPTEDMGLPTSTSWQEATSSYPKQGGNTLAAEIDHQLLNDECLWLRGVAKYGAEANWSYSDVVLAYKGKLATPSGLTITAQNNTTHRVDLAVTNNSQVPDSFIAIVWQPPDNPSAGDIIGVVPNGSSSISGLQCPNWGTASTIGFRAYAVTGTATYTTGSDGVKRYQITEWMRSDETTTGGGIPVAPESVTLTKTSPDVGIHVEWDWSWGDANAADIAWSIRENALTSTQQPDTYRVANIFNPAFDIAGLTAGQNYYVWVRLVKVNGTEVTAGPWSNTASIYLAEAPAMPVATLTKDILAQDDYTTISWTYVSMDKTGQAYAEVAEVVGSTYTKIGDTESAQNLTLSPSELGWATGTTHQLVVRVTSASNQTSIWSDPVLVTIADPITCTITQTSLTLESGALFLKSLPLTVTVAGAGSSGQTTLIIRRAANYTQERPDRSTFNGYDGEVIVRRTYTGEAQQTITADDIIEGSHLDDTAYYAVYAEVQDAYGQHANDGQYFTVNWTHQAIAPKGTVRIVGTAAYITTEAPTGATLTDTVDIYRLSADLPELIYKGAAFGDTIVDPYPAIGDFGGYRLVTITENGDYTAADGEFAWIDVEADFEPAQQLIDFGSIQMTLAYNVELSASWEKDFTSTKYLGGTQDGDWLAGVEKSGGIESVALMENQAGDIAAFRMLAEYSGPVHIRTKDGSSYTANVDVSESQKYTTAGKIRELQLKIQRTRPEEPDGMTQAEWEAS